MIRAKEREVRSPLATAAMLVAVLSVAAAGYFGWQWGTTDDAGPRVVIGQDSGVLEEARVAVVALTTLDSAKPQQSIRQWKQVTTGDLAEAVAAGETDFQKLISSGKVDSTATVQEAAIEAHDDAAGTARVLVALDLTLTPASGEPKLERLRLVVLMDRTDQGWKASGLKSVAGA